MRKYALEYAKDRTKQKVKLPKGIRILRHDGYRGMKVFSVDGVLIRLKLDIDFVFGGTGARYQYIPMREIWIDSDNMAMEDYMPTLHHEFIEFQKMTKERLSYNDAHDLASVEELKVRKYVDQFGWVAANNFFFQLRGR